MSDEKPGVFDALKFKGQFALMIAGQAAKDALAKVKAVPNLEQRVVDALAIVAGVAQTFAGLEKAIRGEPKAGPTERPKAEAPPEEWR